MDRPATWRAIAVDLEAERPFRIGGATLDPLSREASYGDGQERIQPQTLKVLIALARRKGEVVTRSELIDSCWGGRIVGEDVINRSISILREFAARAGGFEIKTVPRTGYRLVETGGTTTSVRSWLVAVIAIALFAAGAIGLYFTGRPTTSASPGREMQVRLAGFTSLSPDVAPNLLQALRDETLAAFADDGAIGITTGASGKSPSAGGYQMGGSVQRQGSGYKVILRIDNALSGASLWSRAFDYSAGNDAEMARLVALDLANMTRCVFGRSITYPKPMPDATLRLMFSGCENDGTINWELDRALDYARRVTIASPDYSAGWSGIAAVVAVLRFQKSPADSAALEREARTGLNTALRIDPRNSEAWALRAYFLPPNDFIGREESLQRAILARPLDCGCEHHAYGLFLNQVGRIREAEPEFQRAVDIMHLNYGLYANLARAQFALGDRAKALETLEAGRRVAREPAEFDLLRAQFAILSGDYSKAVEVLQHTGLADNKDARLLDEAAQALQHRDGAAIARIRESILAQTHNPATNEPIQISLLATLGDTEGAFAAVQRLAMTNPSAAYRTLFDPAFEPAQDDAAFWATAQKLGLVEYWKRSRRVPDLCKSDSAPAACSSLQ